MGRGSGRAGSFEPLPEPLRVLFKKGNALVKDLFD
jgi:hypothetical protein